MCFEGCHTASKQRVAPIEYAPVAIIFVGTYRQGTPAFTGCYSLSLHLCSRRVNQTPAPRAKVIGTLCQAPEICNVPPERYSWALRTGRNAPIRPESEHHDLHHHTHPFGHGSGALVTGCATVPGDPYYDAPRYPVYEQPGYIYSAPQPVYQAPPVYRAPGVIYSAPPPAVYYGGRDRDDNRWDNDRNRGDWRERERERDRAERDRAARERERRDQQAREADRRAREQDQARREQAERDRRAAEDRRNRENRPGRLAPDSYTPSPYDWRSRQQSNSQEKP